MVAMEPRITSIVRNDSTVPAIMKPVARLTVPGRGGLAGGGPYAAYAG